MEKELKYTAFISYNSKDNCTARWLQRRLEHYKLPSVIANEKGDVLKSYDKKNKFRIFRYVTDLVAQNLDDGLRQELDQSKFLIVICSPNSANAPWVRKEVNHFIETGRKKQIIPFVIEGIPYSGDKNECFTPELKKAFPNGSALGVNINDSGDDLWIFRKRKAVAKMVSLLIDLPNAYDFIWNRDWRNYIKLLIIRTFVVIFIGSFMLFAIHRIKQEEPFQMYVNVYEENTNSNLPALEDIEISICIEGETVRKDTLTSLNDTAIFGQIPGRIKGKSMKLIVRNIDCYDIDTVICVSELTSIQLRRNIDRYGTISIVVLKDLEPLRNESVFLDGIEYQTDDNGKLEIRIPYMKQKQSYNINWRGYKGLILMPCIGSPVVELTQK